MLLVRRHVGWDVSGIDLNTPNSKYMYMVHIFCECIYTHINDKPSKITFCTYMLSQLIFIKSQILRNYDKYQYICQLGDIHDQILDISVVSV